MARKYMALYHDMLEAMTPLSDAECGRLIRACLKYSETGETAELNGNERFIFPIIKMQIDRDSKAYDEFCEKQSSKGKTGGRPKKATGFSGNPKKPKQRQRRRQYIY